MKHSESIKAIAPALLAAQKAIEFAKKDSNNPHFKSKYADLSAVVEAVKPALNAAGIVYIQTASPSDDGKLHLTTTLMHESGEWIGDTLVMPLPKQDPQGYGSALTYGRRYALAAITGVYQDDDDGNAASGVGQRQAKATPSFDYDEAEAAITAATEIPALQAAFAGFWKVCPRNSQAALKAAYDTRKEQLSQPQEA
ncbi:ERF family protein [Schauerella aestuarii]|uniref:ERF family protein n=1 Tax=Schauerella aestuarii TaxID=2511204 RepID=UPI00136AF4F1|nr:ERF family protein [Achromobacter aestuarii]MYZ41387.1 ERF superfamily protein [Achromobacter aestuarii]